MPGTKVKIRACLCPHRNLADKSADPTWPYPAGVVIELTKAGGGYAKALNATNADGEVSDELDDAERTRSP
jgi:hypothetical protein